VINLIENMSGLRPECGVDEAGCGPAFGPVVAAAVILPDGWYDPMLNDSKKVTEKKRDKLYHRIVAEAVSWSVAQVGPAEIDEINILQARLMAMRMAIQGLELRPSHVLVDGDKFLKDYFIPHTCVIGGDGKYTSIAAASIVAKWTRDFIIRDMATKYNKWGLDKNKGYLTREHIELINMHGLSDQHRRTFCKRFI
jgi:ribonuclease HII